MADLFSACETDTDPCELKGFRVLGVGSAKLGMEGSDSLLGDNFFYWQRFADVNNLFRK